MKLALVFLALVGAAFAAPHIQGDDSLRPAFDQLKETLLCTEEELIVIVEKALANDAELAAYFQEEFPALRDFLEKVEEVGVLIKYLDARGLFVREFLDRLYLLLGVDKSVAVRAEGDFLEEILACVDTTNILTVLLELLGSDSAIQDLLIHLSRGEVSDAYHIIRDHKEIKRLVQLAREAGAEIDTIFALLEALLGWKEYVETPAVVAVAPKADDLRPAFEELQKHLDLACIIATITDHAGTADGQEILDYLQGPQFAVLLKQLAVDEKELKIVEYLEKNGLENVREVLRELFEALGVAYPETRRAVSPFGLAEDLQKCIDLDALAEAVLRLLGEDEAVQNLLVHLSRKEVAESYRLLKALDEFVDFVARLVARGIDMDTLLALVEAILGW